MIKPYTLPKGYSSVSNDIKSPFKILKESLLKKSSISNLPTVLKDILIVYNSFSITILDKKTLGIEWEIEVPNDIREHELSYPVVHNEVMIVEDVPQKSVYVYNLKNGQLMNQLEGFQADLYPFEGYLFGFTFNNGSACIAKFEYENGFNKAWEISTSVDWSTRVLLNNDKLVFNTDTGFHCHDWETGRFLWEYEVIEYANPYEHLLWNEQVIIPRGDGIVSLDIHTGQVQWQQNLPFTQGTIYGDKVHLIDAQRYAVLDAKTGKVEANVELTSNYQGFEDRMQNALTYGLAVTEDYAIYGSSSGYLFIIDKWTGELVWHLQRSIFFNTTPIVDGNRIYVAGSGFESANILVIEGS